MSKQEPYKLRPYQQEAIDITEASVAFGADNLILRAVTSWGKSSYAAGICKKFDDKHIVIMVNIEPLINQISETLTAMNVEHSILKAGRESEYDESCLVQIVMSQTYYSRADKLNLKADIVLIDERHKEYDTPRTRKLLTDLKPSVIIGMTATNWDEKGYKLHNSETIDTHGITELVDDGYLCPIKYYVPKWAERVDYSKVTKSGNDYSTKSLDEVVNTPKHIKQTIQAMNQLDAKNKKTLIFCTTIEQCDHITAELKKEGYAVEAYHSGNTKNENTRILDSFMYGSVYTGSDAEHQDTTLFNQDNINKDHKRVTCLASVAKLTTGFSDNEVQLGVNLRKTKVMSLYHQIAGRMMRIAPGKEFAEFLDLGQCVSRFGFPQDKYDPPERALYDEDSKQLLDEATKHLTLEHLDVTLDDEIGEVTRDNYELKIQEIKASKKKLSNMTTKELSAKMELEDDPVVIIAILATLFDKIHCNDMKNKWGSVVRGYIDRNGKEISNFRNGSSIEWIAEKWVELLPQQDAYHKRKYLKAMRTRSKNLLREKGNIWSIKFFIEFLVKEDNPEPEPEEEIVGTYDIEYEGINEDEIPF